jgi:hypothetical protein
MPVIPVTWEVEIGRILVQGQPGEKVSETTSQPISGSLQHVLVISAMKEAQVGGSWSEVSPGQKCEALSKM